MRILNRNTLSWQEATSVTQDGYYVNTTFYPEWQIMEADPITELPEISLLRQYPGLFDVIATKKQIQNGEWIYVSSYKDGGTPIQIWKHIYAPDLLAEVFGSHINTFMNTDAGAFFYSAKYDKFILYSAGSYSETSEDPDRERVIYETAPIIRRLYGKEDT